MLDHPDDAEIATVGGDVDVRNIVAEPQSPTTSEPDEYLSSQCERFTGFVRGMLHNVAQASRQTIVCADKKRSAADEPEEHPPAKKLRI